jgi:hypothetical protein
MNATLLIDVPSYMIVPREGGVAWIEAHGPLAQGLALTASASLSDWDAAGASVQPDGTLAPTSLDESLRESAALVLRADPAIREWDATEALRAIVVQHAAERAEREARREERRAEREAHERYLAERDAEIEARGVALQARVLALRTWAMSAAALPGNIRRAASEGRDVRVAVRRAIHERILAVLEKQGLTTLRETREIEEDERVPTERAYEVLDLLSGDEMREDLTACAFGLPELRLSSEFVRVRLPTREWRSAVELEISHPWLADDAGECSDCGCYVLTEDE